MVWIFLQPNQSLASADHVLDQLMSTAENISNGLAGMAVRPASDAYVRWVEDAEERLRETFVNYGHFRLHDDRHWRIREVDEASVRPIRMIDSQLREVLFKLAEVRAQLATYARMCGAESTALAILDSNIFHHYQDFTDIPWPTVLKAKQVQILVPLVVVDELDSQKYSASSRVSRRASKVISQLRGLELRAGSATRYAVRDSVDLEFVPEPSDHVRRSSNDDEIVRQASYVSSITPNRVVLVTADLGMQVRAEPLAVESFVLPANYLAKQESNE